MVEARSESIKQSVDQRRAPLSIGCVCSLMSRYPAQEPRICLVILCDLDIDQHTAVEQIGAMLERASPGSGSDAKYSESGTLEE